MADGRTAAELEAMGGDIAALWGDMDALRAEVAELRGELGELTRTLAGAIRSETIAAAVADGYARLRTARDEEACERLEEDRARRLADDGAPA